MKKYAIAKFSPHSGENVITIIEAESSDDALMTLLKNDAWDVSSGTLTEILSQIADDVYSEPKEL